ncbi:Reverse transcriptase [Theobroma cacao]|nr:Reverse transcriptase [Theobroma cacao]
MQSEFDMSMMGELKYFLGLHIKQSKEGIFINQEKYTHDMLKKFDVLKLKSTSTPMSPSTKLDLDEKGKNVDQKLYKDVDFAGNKTDRKSTSGTCQFLGKMLVSWSSKKQNSVALSTAKAEYVSLGYSTFKNRSYSPSLVKEFYSGIALKEKELAESDDYVEDGLNVYLNGKEFIVTAEDLGNLLEIEGEIGRNGSLSYISLQDLWLMEHAFNGVSLNLGRFMIEKMRSAYRLDKVNLPCGNVITSLVQKKGIWAKKYDINLVKTRDQAIYYGNLIKKGYVLDGEKFLKTSKTGPRKNHNLPAQPEEAPFRFSNEIIFNLLMRIDEQGTKVATAETEKQQASSPNSEKVSIMNIFHQMVREEQAEKDTIKIATQKDGANVRKGKKHASTPKLKAKTGKLEATTAPPAEAKQPTKRRKTMATKTTFLKRRKSFRLTEKSKPVSASSPHSLIHISDKSIPESSLRKSSPLQEPSPFPLNSFYGTASSPSASSDE